MEKNLTQQFLESIEAVAEKEIPEVAIARAKRSLMDYLAITAAGAATNREKLKTYFAQAEPEAGKYTLIGMQKTTNLKEAVFLNGLNAHTLDFDDGTNTGIIHLGSPIFSVLLPLAQKHGKSLGEVLRAAVIGYETSFTMAVSIQPTHKLMGYHATGTCGVLGIAMAISYLLNFTPEQRRNAFAVAAVSATGMLKVLDDASELKPYNVAKSALLGLSATQIAQAGFMGHHDPLGGGRGYLKMMTGLETIGWKQPLLNGTYAINKSYTKPYAACRYTHPSIEAAIAAGKQDGLKAEDIQEIRVRTYDLAVAGHDHREISGPASAKMSIPYSVAVGLIYGKAGFAEYDEDHTKNPEILRLTEKVSVAPDPVLSAAFPKEQTAIVEFVAGGKVYTHRVDFPKGEPENPMTDEEFTQRFVDLMAIAGMDETNAKRIMSLCDKEETPAEALLAIL